MKRKQNKWFYRGIIWSLATAKGHDHDLVYGLIVDSVSKRDLKRACKRYAAYELSGLKQHWRKARRKANRDDH